MDKKIQIIALFGPSGCGKDTVKNILVNQYHLHSIVTSTTRPKRENEIDGVNYHYLTNEQFANLVINGEMIEATEFNNWFYGTQQSALKEDVVNVGIFNIQAIECLREDNNFDLFPVYLLVPDKERLLRSLLREEKCDCKEICRRFLADKKDFADIDFPHFEIDNYSTHSPERTAEEIYDLL